MRDTNSQNYVEVNGSTVERNYHEGNLREARSVEWAEELLNPEDGHVHCMICWIELDPAETKTAYSSSTGWLCDYCYKTYILGAEQTQSCM